MFSVEYEASRAADKVFNFGSGDLEWLFLAWNIQRRFRHNGFLSGVSIASYSYNPNQGHFIPAVMLLV
jgi:hypothetical protein